MDSAGGQGSCRLCPLEGLAQHEGSIDALSGKLGLGRSKPNADMARPELGKLDGDRVDGHGVRFVELNGVSNGSGMHRGLRQPA